MIYDYEPAQTITEINAKCSTDNWVVHSFLKAKGAGTFDVMYQQYVPQNVSLTQTEQIINGDNSFWISKQLDYGQILILTFLLMLFVGFAVKTIWNYARQDSSQKI
jgi:hypothetical protein